MFELRTNDLSVLGTLSTNNPWTNAFFLVASLCMYVYMYVCMYVSIYLLYVCMYDGSMRVDMEHIGVGFPTSKKRGGNTLHAQAR